MTIEERLSAAFRTADLYQPSPDLFERVTESIEEDAAHRRRVRRVALAIMAALGFVAIYLFLAIDRVDGVLEMPFWSLEVLVTSVMIALVVVLGPAIRRFGTSFESDVFHSNTPTGRGFLRLMDVAYYMIFGAYTVMSLRYSPEPGGTLAEWMELQSWRVAGLLMLMGVLHVVTLAVLPVIGLVFSANIRRARRAQAGGAVLPANPRNDQIDRWITILVWIVVGLGLLQLAVLVLPLIVGLGG